MAASPLHLFHLCEDLSPVGGAAWHLRSVLERGNPGWRATVVTGRGAGGCGQGRTPSDGQRGGLPDSISMLTAPGLGGRLRDQERAVAQVAALVQKARPDLLHVHNLMQPALLRAVAGMAPAIYTLQDHRVFCPGRGMVTAAGTPCLQGPAPARCAGCFEDEAYAVWIQALTEARLAALRGYRRVVVLSHYMAAELVRVGLPNQAVEVIPPFPWGMHHGLRPVSEVGQVVLAAGRLVKTKGFQVLIEAWARAGVDLPLVICGAGPQAGALQRQAAALGLLGSGEPRAGAIHFTGWLSHPQLVGWMRRARSLVLPSLWAEPFGIVGLEALYLGVPVVGFRVGGVGEWLHDGVGWLLEPGDVAGLENALRQASRPHLAAERGLAGRLEIWQKYQPAVLNARLHGVYEAALRSAAVG